MLILFLVKYLIATVLYEIENSKNRYLDEGFLVILILLSMAFYAEIVFALDSDYSRTLWHVNSFSIIMTRYGKNAVWNDFVLPIGLDSSSSLKQRLTMAEFYKMSSKNDKMTKMIKW